MRVEDPTRKSQVKRLLEKMFFFLMSNLQSSNFREKMF
jgi:hypothetical protein